MYGNKTEACIVRLQSGLGPGNMIRSHTNHSSSEGEG